MFQRREWLRVLDSGPLHDGGKTPPHQRVVEVRDTLSRQCGEARGRAEGSAKLAPFFDVADASHFLVGGHAGAGDEEPHYGARHCCESDAERPVENGL